MARYCIKCGKKLGFFEEDYNDMCQTCYDRNIEEERKILEKKKRQEQIIKENQNEQRKKELEEINKKEQIQKQNIEKEKQHKKELLKKLLINNPMILDRLNNMINMIPTGRYGNLKKEKNYFSNDGYLSEILFELLIWTYCKMPDEFTLRDIDNINTYEFLIESRLDLKEFFKEDINKNYLELESYINKKVCDYDNCEKFLFANSNIYVFHELQMQEDDQWADYEMNYIGKIADEGFPRIAKISENMRRLVYFKEIYSYAITVFYGLEFSKNMEVIEKSEELNKIYNNLTSTTEDMEYIANKLYEMYKNFYTDLFEMKMFPKQFYNLVYLFKWKESYNYKYLKDDEYENIISELKENNVNNKLQIVIDKIECSNCISAIEQLGNDKSSAFKILLLDTITRVGQYLDYDDIVLFLKNLYKNADELAEFANKQIAIKEKERLLNGDMSKEIKKEQLEVDYSNVQNGYEFEHYVADLYKKLGYKIEEITKKSGDQRSRCYCIQR